MKVKLTEKPHYLNLLYENNWKAYKNATVQSFPRYEIFLFKLQERFKVSTITSEEDHQSG